MKAVIKTGGKQYQVAKGDVLKVEKLPETKAGKKLVFDKVLAIIDKDKVTLGAPYLAKAKVEASLMAQLKEKKIDVAKYKSKTRYRRVIGHRQPKSQIKIENILV